MVQPSTGRSTRNDKCHEYMDSLEFMFALIACRPTAQGAVEIEDEEV